MATLCLSITLFLAFTLLFYALGSAVMRAMFRRLVQTDDLDFAIRLILGVLATGWCAAAAVAIAQVLKMASLEISNSLLRPIFCMLFAGLVFSALRNPANRSQVKRAAPALFCVMLYYLLGTAAACFPDGNFREASAAQTMLLTNLSTDNLIPYNFSRYFVERRDPNSVEVVPTWRAGERGPLAGAVTATVFIALDLKESAPWNETSAGTYFVYQALGTYLNCLALLVVWIVAVQLSERLSSEPNAAKATGFYAMVLAGSSYFFFVDTFYTWPKFLAAVCVVIATLMRALHPPAGGAQWFLCAVLLGTGVLAHDMVLFPVAAFLAVCSVLAVRDGQLSAFARGTVLGAGVTLVPWQIYKSLHLLPAVRGAAYHFFCFNEPVAGPNFWNVARAFWNEQTFGSVAVRIAGNAALPFEPPANLSKLGSPLVFLNHSYRDAFVPLCSGLGWCIVALAIWGIALHRSRPASILHWMLLAGFGGFAISALTAGCDRSLGNHVWAYPAFIILPAIAAIPLARSSAAAALAAVGVGLNAAQAALFLWYHAAPKPYLHASVEYGVTLAILSISFVATALCFAALSRRARHEHKAAV